MTAHDVRLPGWDLTVSRGVDVTLRAVDPPVGAGDLALWIGGDTANLDAPPDPPGVIPAVADGDTWTWTVPGVEVETLIRWSVDGESPASVGWLRPSRLGAPSPTVDVALRLDEITVDLTLLGGRTDTAPLAARVTTLETTLAAAIRPSWTVSDETEVLSQAERSAVAPHWPDGPQGYADIAGTLWGFASSGLNSARWERDPDGQFVQSVATTTAAIDTGDPQVSYASGGPILHDTDTGRLWKIYHYEKNPHPGNTAHFWAGLGLAYADQATPDTWVDVGPIITPQRPFTPGQDSHAEIGGGSHLIVDGWVLIYYHDTSDTGVWSSASVARCRLTDIYTATPGNPPQFTKLHGGDWTSPGLGGPADDLLPGATPHPHWPEVIHLTDHDRYLMVYGAWEGNDGMSLWCRTGVDPLSWGLPQRITDVEPVELLYCTLSGVDLTARSTSGDEVTLTYVRSESGWPHEPGWDRWADAAVCSRTLTYDPTIGGGGDGADLGDPEDWHEITELDNGWVAADPEHPAIRYRRHAGTLYLDVPLLAGGTSSDQCATLPEGYRPTSAEQVVTLTMDGAGAIGIGVVAVGPTGIVIPTYVDPAVPIFLGARLACRLPTST